MKSYRYSPLPMKDYRISSLAECEVTFIMGIPSMPVLNEMGMAPAMKRLHMEAAWNLAWLSLPGLDALPIWGKTPKWYKHYLPIPGAISAILSDSLGDEVFFQKLLLSPNRFIEWFEREEHEQYACYEVLAGEEWVKGVLHRAQESADRMSASNDEMPENWPSNVVQFKAKQTT